MSACSTVSSYVAFGDRCNSPNCRVGRSTAVGMAAGKRICRTERTSCSELGPSISGGRDGRTERSARSGERGTLAQEAYRELESRSGRANGCPTLRSARGTLAPSLNTGMQPVRDAFGRLVAASAFAGPPDARFACRWLRRKQADEIWSIRVLVKRRRRPDTRKPR
jgi:hypothetical protein